MNKSEHKIRREILAKLIPKMTKLAVKYETMLDAAESAAAWLCECSPGTDQRERGDALRNALNALRRKPKL